MRYRFSGIEPDLMDKYGIKGIPSSDIAGGAVAKAGSFRSAYLGADPTVS